MLLIPYILGLNYGLTLSYRICHIKIGEGSRGSLGLVGMKRWNLGTMDQLVVMEGYD